MDSEARKDLKDQIWFTRISRTNAERRLNEKVGFIQFVNIYYSLLSIICSILSYHFDDSKMGLFTIILTIILLLSIAYLNGQNYQEMAKDYRTNYTRLQMLEMEAAGSRKSIEEINKDYCDLLDSSCNHIEFDYLKAISISYDEYKDKKDWKHKKIRYYWEISWRCFIKLTVIMAPIIILIICEVWAY